jgi:hypothetical protein
MSFSLKQLVEKGLTDDMRVIIFGLGDDYFDRAKNSIESSWKDLGGGSGLTESQLEDKLKDLQRETLPTTGYALGTFSAQLKISEEYKFFRSPAIETAAKTVDGYGQVIGSILSTKEELQYEYGTMARQAAQSVYYLALTSNALIRAFRVAKALKNVSTFTRISRAVSSGAAMTGVGLLWAVVQFAIGEAIGLAAQKAGEALMEGRATRLAIQSAAPQIMKPDTLLQDYSAYQGTYLMQEGGYNVYPTMENILTSEYRGVSPEMFGRNYSDAINTTAQINTSAIIDRNTYLGYTERSLQMSGLYGRDMTGTLATMSRVNLGGDVDEASGLFQKFFSSMVSDGRLHLSQLALVDEMSSFAESYVVGGRLNLEDGASNLARTHAFVNPMLGDRQTTQATQTLVTGLDAVLQEGALGTSPHMSMIMARTGITRGEALGGVTSQPETLEKFLYGMYLELGIGNTDFNSEGELGDEDMERFMAYSQHGLGMDQATQRATYVAYRGFVQGARGEDVSRAYADAFEEYAAEDYPEYSITSLAKSWTKGSRVLTDVLFSYTDVMVKMDRAILKLAKELAPIMLPEMQRTITSTSQRTSRYALGLQRDGSSGGRASSTNEARLDPGVVTSEPSSDEFTRLFNSLIQQESGGVHRTSSGALLESPVGARGITQVMVATGESPGYGVAPLKDQSEAEYIRFGQDYLQAMLEEYDNDIKKALAAYNWGPGNVNRAIENYGEDWLEYAPKETKDYVRLILGRLNSVGGQISGGTYSPIGRRSSQIIPNYVNIDLEINGIRTGDFARHFQSSFVRA